MAPIGQTLTNNVGPLPVWGWAGIGTAGLAGYLYYRNKKNAAASAQSQSGISSNLGSVPLSNLTTNAEPMPVEVGPTFVNVNTPTGQPGSAPAPVNQGWYITQAEANFLAHTTPAQRKTIATQPSSKWGSIPGIQPYMGWLAHLTPSQRQYLANTPSQYWPVAPAGAPQPPEN